MIQTSLVLRPRSVLCKVVLALACLACFLTPSLLKADELLLIQTVSGGIEIIHAVEKQNDGTILAVTDPSGRKSIWQANMLFCSLPIRDKKLEYADGDIAKVIVAFEEMSQKYGESSPLLQSELESWRELKTAHLEAIKQKRAETDAKISKLLEKTYLSEDTPYSKKQLSAHIQNLEKWAQLLPERSEEIQTHLKPFRNHLANLEAGKERFEGQWRTSEEVRDIQELRRRAEEERILQKASQIQLPRLVAPQHDVYLALGCVGFSLILMILCFLSLLRSWMHKHFGFWQYAMLAILLAMSGGYAFFGTQFMNGPQSLADLSKQPTSEGDEGRPYANVKRLLYLSAKPKLLPTVKPEDLSITINTAELNEFFKQNLQLTSPAPTLDQDVTRSGLAFGINTRKITIYEEVSFQERSFLLSYHIPYQVTQDQILFGNLNVKLGHAPLPGKLGIYFWSKLQSPLTKLVQDRGITNSYQINLISQNQLTLTNVLTVAEGTSASTR